MAGALTQAINFPSSVAGLETRKTCTLTINGQLNITKNSVKMAFSTVNAPALIMRKFSGLRVSNALDRALKPQVDFHSRIASKIYFRQAKPTRLAPKARFADLRFTEKADKSLQYSEKEARRLGHDTIGTEDVLLGLIAQRSGIGAKVLKAMGITLEDARIATEKLSGKRSPIVFEELTYSPLVDSLFEKAKSLACDYIGPEHLLLAIISEGYYGSTAAAEVLESLKVDPSKIRQEVIRIVGEMPTLKKWGTNLIKLAEEDELDPVIGREIEVQRVIEILDTKNNLWLIGERGVGKTTIVNGLAQRIADNLAPKTLVGKKVIRLDMSQLVDGVDSCGEFEDRIKKLMEEIRQNDNIILFIDELETSIETGTSEGTIDAKNILKLALARGELQCIVATTLDEYKKHIENDPALERRFQTVEVLEPSVEETIQILRGLREVYEIDNEVRYTDDALVAAVELSNQHFKDYFLPDKAIRLIKQAGMWVLFKAYRLSREARRFEEDKRRVVREENEASFQGAIHIRDLDLLTAIISKCKEMSKAGLKEGGFTVTVADVGDVASYWTIPYEKVWEQISQKNDADGVEGSSKSTMPTLEGCFKELMKIITRQSIARLEDLYDEGL